jgi:putative transposase
VHWFNHQRLHSIIGYVPPAEYENEYYRQSQTDQQPLSGQPALH